MLHQHWDRLLSLGASALAIKSDLAKALRLLGGKPYEINRDVPETVEGQKPDERNITHFRKGKESGQ